MVSSLKVFRKKYCISHLSGADDVLRYHIYIQITKAPYCVLPIRLLPERKQRFAFPLLLVQRTCPAGISDVPTSFYKKLLPSAIFPRLVRNLFPVARILEQQKIQTMWPGLQDPAPVIHAHRKRRVFAFRAWRGGGGRRFSSTRTLSLSANHVCCLTPYGFSHAEGTGRTSLNC